MFISMICPHNSFVNTGFDAVEYKSAMNEKRYNLAIFNDDKLVMESSVHYKVNNLKYDRDFYTT